MVIYSIDDRCCLADSQTRVILNDLLRHINIMLPDSREASKKPVVLDFGRASSASECSVKDNAIREED